jgi:hypothetical protein
MDLPTFNDATDATDAVRGHGRALIPWLPDPPNCPECDAMLYADVTFDPTMAEYVNSWTCRACDAPDRYRDDPDATAPEPPRRGATALREVFDTQ